ncbi:MAG: pentapeptide repeat-containing protein [Cyanobacteria bacterium P01_C01_bin.38]
MSRDALVVGINTYSYECLNNLKAPARDAEAVAQLLEKHGDFKVTRLPAAKDKENSKPKLGQTSKVSLTKLEEKIVQLFKPEGKPPNTALLYFSGHGLRKNQGIQEGFLASSDVNPENGNWGIRLKWLRELLQESEVKQQIIILDCCYSGELLNFTEADPGDRGKGRDRCFIAASRSYEVAYENIDNQHSVFTAALLKGLEPLQDRWVTNYTLVERLNQEHNSFPQRPIFGNSGETINLTRRWVQTGEVSTIHFTDVCPYKGLRYFDCVEEDAKYFYGRTALTDKLIDKLRTGNFLAVLGASGSGKSSVVRAGLLYKLKIGQRISGSENWSIKIFKPGEYPLQSLAELFLDTNLSSIERASQLAQAEELIAKGASGLRQLVTVNNQRLVLVVDQFEEVFTLCKSNEERSKFFDCLLGALQQCGDKLCLVLTMRSDFFGKCTEQEYSGLAQQIQNNLVTITPMARDELKQAIEEPAKQVELNIEPELIEEMLVDVENAPGSLPLLQDTLTELWKKRSNNCLQVKTYSQLGGVMGTLRQRANKVYESFNEEEQAVCKQVFLALTQLGEGTEDTRRRVFKQDLVNKYYSEELIDSVIQQLADEKLIVTSEIVAKGDESERVVVVDVAHEALIRYWGLLRGWIDENRDKLRQKRKIEAAAEEWQEKNKLKGYLLQGRQLQDAQVFKEEQHLNLALSNLATNFIQKSAKYKWNNRFRFIGSAFIPIIYLTAFFSFFGYKELKLRRHWDAIEAAKGEEFSPARISALQELVKLNISLAGIPLSNTNLSNVNLSDANLIGANLSNANLSDANLSDANLIGANLRDANLRDARLHYANFIRANLSRTNLSKTRLYDANLSRARLYGANLENANLSGADLNGAIFWDKESGKEAKNLTLEQIKQAENWEKAIYSPEFRKELGLPPRK